MMVLIAAATVGWFHFTTDSRPPKFYQQSEEFGSGSKLVILEPLKKRFIVNQANGTKIFVLEGQIKSTYPANIEIDWIEVKGVLFDRQNKRISESTAYAGKSLTIDQLKRSSRKSIDSSLALQTNQSNRNLNLGSEQTVPFLIVFLDVPTTIDMKIEVKINRFIRKTQ